MTELLPFLKSLLSVSGLSGCEAPAARLIEAQWRPLVDEIHVSRLGSLHALKRGSGHSTHSILIAAHMDAIGLIVQRVVDGFIYCTLVGSTDIRVLPGTPVLIHTSSGELPGVMAMPAPRHLPEGERNKAPAIEYLVIDTGLSAGQVSRRVRVGDLVSLNTSPVEMPGGVVSGHSVDNRASVAALTLALEELQSRPHAWDVWAVATTQEETTYAGAATSAFELSPDLAIAVDTTFARGPGTGGWDSFELGQGPTLGIGPNIHPFLFERFKELAARAGIPYALEAVPDSSYTDGMELQVAGAGLPTMLVSIPIRYMHTPVELVALRDIQRTGRLLAEFITALEPDFIEKIVWE